MTKSRTQSGNPNRHPRRVITQLDLDRFYIRTTSHPEEVIPTIGKKRFVEAVGIDLIVRHYVEELGLDEFIEILLEVHRRKLGEASKQAAVGVPPSSTSRVESCRES